MKCQIMFSGENKKKKNHECVISAYFAQRVVKFNLLTLNVGDDIFLIFHKS